MAELKTQRNDANVEAFITAVPDEKNARIASPFWI